MRRRLLAAGALLHLTLAACANPSATSCAIPPRNPGDPTVCVDFVAITVPASQQATFESSVCTRLHGAYSTAGSCSSDTRVARCTETTVDGSDTYTLRLNYYAPTTAADVQAACPPPMPPAQTTFEFQAN
jgi:hypothetical protein